MSRPIKFRVWDKRERVMHLIFDSTQQTEWFLPNLNERFEIMQYTGLTDRNGKEIYEGDIVRIYKLTFQSGHLPENLYVKFYSGMFQLYRGNENLMGLHLQYIEDGEVIGNIYEHPLLLEQKESAAE